MNQKFIHLIFCASLGFFAAAPVVANGLVREFSGEGSTETVEFEVKAPWLLDWRVNTEYLQMMGVQVSLVDAKTGQHQGYVLNTKYPGNGVRLMDQGGRFRLRIDATLTYWTFKVEQLTREEAELYKPEGPGRRLLIQPPSFRPPPPSPRATAAVTPGHRRRHPGLDPGPILSQKQRTPIHTWHALKK